MICIRYPTLLKQKYNRQASHDTCLCVYLIACTAAVQRGLAVQCRGCRPAQLHRGIHSPKQRRLRSMCPTLPEAVFCPRMSVSPCLLRRFIMKETVSAPSYRLKTSDTNARSAGQSGGDVFRRTEVLAGFLRHDARHRINAVCPLCFCIVKDKPIVRRFDAAAHKDFLGKADFIRASGIVQRDFLRVRLKNEVIRLNDAAVPGIYLVRILLLRGVELQDVAGLA